MENAPAASPFSEVRIIAFKENPFSIIGERTTTHDRQIRIVKSNG